MRASRARSARAILMDWARQPDGPAIRNGLPYSRIAHLAEDVRPFVAVASALRAAASARRRSTPRTSSTAFCCSRTSATACSAARWRRARRPGGAVARGDGRARRAAAAPPEAAAPTARASLPAYDHGALGIEVELLIDWYWPALHGAAGARRRRARVPGAVGRAVFDRLGALPRGWVLRDYHSPNLLWLPRARQALRASA